jgi:drug/metabolite transporter (DMT)-like permease
VTTGATPTQPARLSRLASLALLWGSNFLWIKLALRGLAPAQLVFVRLSLGAVVLTAFLRARGDHLPRGRGVWAHLTLAALFACVVPYLLFAYGEQRVDSSIAGLLNATTPLWTALIAMAVRLERDVTPMKVTGLAIGFLGALVIFEPWRLGSQVLSWGGLACLVAAACYGVSFVYMARYLRRPELSPLALSAGQLVVSAALTALTLPLLGRAAPHVRADALVAVVILGALGTGLAYLINYQLISESGASRTAVVTYLLPVVAVALGALVLGETLALHELVGAAVVLAGVALTRRRPAPATSTTRT